MPQDLALDVEPLLFLLDQLDDIVIGLPITPFAAAVESGNINDLPRQPRTPISRNDLLIRQDGLRIENGRCLVALGIQTGNKADKAVTRHCNDVSHDCPN